MEFDTQVIRRRLVLQLTKAAVSAETLANTKEAMAMLEKYETTQAAETHRQHVADLKDDPVALCRYLGELGETPKDCEKYLGRELSQVEIEANADGQRDRAREIKAIQLQQARSGGKVERWMLKG